MSVEDGGCSNSQYSITVIGRLGSVDFDLMQSVVSRLKAARANKPTWTPVGGLRTKLDVQP